METITKQQIKEAVNAFLHRELDRELDFELSKLKKVSKEKIQEKKIKLLETYNYSRFFNSLFESIEFMMDQNLSLATHTSKGINSLVKSDNVIYNYENKPNHNYVCHESIGIISIDANSNNTGSHAGHLKAIVDFLNIEVNSAKMHYFFICSKDAFLEIFKEASHDSKKTYLYYDYLRDRLVSNVVNPYTDGLNKQILFSMSSSHLDYKLLVPLYPSSLAYCLFERVNKVKFSDHLKSAKKAHYKGEDLKPFQSFNDLAVTKLGGDNAQNVGRLNNKQNGRNYLLPSLPPQFQKTKQFNIPEYANSIFDKTLDFHCKETFKALIRLLKTQYNNVNIRKSRQAILDQLLFEVVSIASTIQQQEAPGWSHGYSLNYSEKLWLDPQRGEVEGEEAFKQDRDNENWQADISHRFASWVNTTLRKELKHIKHDFADAEHREWQKEMDDMMGQSQRLGQGVFL